ncbi:DUF1284 domain-containing protein [Caldicellulosiruptor changbaiensis]|uniref:DUF1284 domain-containing protein n=1 Tax=Caldicellulosiruptor changbaiensis TaxID=1222016 RepID=A0A3T0D2N4_9FIRM|nr:DUF1284 domain-containing protein [Caldicellulosiruptor changbaiensis]AZT89289.1 DUF1284 domain-containing protein [Caldicellulosiruptor changbaiensis]
MIELRFHHLLCFLGFRGLGYNKEFVDNFRKVYEKVFTEGQKVILVTHPDVICQKCPRLVDGICTAEDKVENFDVKLREFLCKNGISNFDNVLPSEIYKVIKKLSTQEFEDICRSCEWFSLGYCKEGLLKLKSEQN